MGILGLFASFSGALNISRDWIRSQGAAAVSGTPGKAVPPGKSLTQVFLRIFCFLSW